jgi:hypothetical protein
MALLQSTGAGAGQEKKRKKRPKNEVIGDQTVHVGGYQDELRHEKRIGQNIQRYQRMAEALYGGKEERKAYKGLPYPKVSVPRLKTPERFLQYINGEVFSPDGSYSNGVIAPVVGAWSRLPRSVRSFLREQNLRVHIVDADKITQHPRLRQYAGQWNTSHKTRILYDEAAGLSTGGNIYIVVKPGGATKRVALHEMAHEADSDEYKILRALGRLTAHKAKLRAYGEQPSQSPDWKNVWAGQDDRLKDTIHEEFADQFAQYWASPQSRKRMRPEYRRFFDTYFSE